ncbi:ABC transporter permease [Heyndrickxia sporothermodurans]|nr:ABC transporter permease [Heyndrickxia sporothermodurans]
MIGFINYQWKSYIRSLKIIPPLTVFLGWIILFYTYKNVPILSSYAVTSIVSYLVLTWIAMGIFSIEDTNEKPLLFVQLTTKYYYLVGKWVVCLLITLILTLFSILYPILMNNFTGPIKPIHIGLSIYSHLVLALFGILVGSFFSVTSFATKKYAWLSAMLVIVVSISYEGIVEKVVWLKWVLIPFPPVVFITKYMSTTDTVHIGSDFYVHFLYAIIYITIGLIIVVKMFLKKER